MRTSFRIAGIYPCFPFPGIVLTEQLEPNHGRYVPYGRVGEVLPYLIRRAQENSDMLGGVGKELGLLRKEIKRRILGI